MFLALLKTLRPKQWIKNLLVGAPLVFSQRLLDLPSLGLTAAAVVLFCLLSGAVYVINDLVDVENDRTHPRKRARPIASGALPRGTARVAAAALVPAALGGALWMGWPVAAVMAGYFALQLAYCFGIKRIPYLDVLAIAAGFVLRVWAGSLAIAVEPSPWLLVCTAVLAAFLGFGKRAHELGFSGERAPEQRAALARYNKTALRLVLYLLAGLSVVVYALYVESDHVRAAFGDRSLVYTLPFPVIGILRFVHLVTTRQDAESPTDEMLRDPLFMANLGLFVVVLVAVLYGG